MSTGVVIQINQFRSRMERLRIEERLRRRSMISRRSLWESCSVTIRFANYVYYTPDLQLVGKD